MYHRPKAPETLFHHTRSVFWSPLKSAAPTGSHVVSETGEGVMPALPIWFAWAPMYHTPMLPVVRCHQRRSACCWSPLKSATPITCHVVSEKPVGLKYAALVWVTPFIYQTTSPPELLFHHTRSGFLSPLKSPAPTTCHVGSAMDGDGVATPMRVAPFIYQTSNFPVD